MALIVGMDEAGYGPNLGPLVVSAVAWDVPGDPHKIDLWHEFAGIVSPEPASDGAWVQVADSKQVYSPARGLMALELGVLAALRLKQRNMRAARADADSGDGAEEFIPASLEHMRRWLSPASCSREGCPEPWHRDVDLRLPFTDFCRDTLRRLQDAWHDRCLARGIRLHGICCDIVQPARFNVETRRLDSKGRALSEISMKVLAALLGDAAGDEPALIVADKHGGRNRYHEFLPLAFGDRFIRCREERMERSRYQVGAAEIRFETKAERHLPVALASMISKYARELSMVLFNRYWMAKLPGLKPTAGYPNDAVRFRQEIAALQRDLGIADEVLWRAR